jgi:putative Mn2+ efflux pump MntP
MPFGWQCSKLALKNLGPGGTFAVLKIGNLIIDRGNSRLVVRSLDQWLSVLIVVVVGWWMVKANTENRLRQVLNTPSRLERRSNSSQEIRSV